METDSHTLEQSSGFDSSQLCCVHELIKMKLSIPHYDLQPQPLQASLSVRHWPLHMHKASIPSVPEGSLPRVERLTKISLKVVADMEKEAF